MSQVSFASLQSSGATISNTKRTVYVPVTNSSDTLPPIIGYEDFKFVYKNLKLYRGKYVHVYKKTMNSKTDVPFLSLCAYCASPYVSLTRDHMMPKCLGYDIKDNMSMVCVSCNVRKGGQSLGKWLSTELRFNYSDPIVHTIFYNVDMLIRTNTTYIKDVYCDWNKFFYSF